MDLVEGYDSDVGAGRAEQFNNLTTDQSGPSRDQDIAACKAV